MTKDIQVAIIEDDADIRQLLQLLINGSPGFTCQRTYSSVEEGVPALLEQPSDLLLMDIDLPQQSGIQGVQQLRAGKFSGQIIMLTVHEDEEAIFNSLCAGAVGYLVKGLPPVQLLDALTEAHAGGAPMSTAIARKVVQSFRPRPLEEPLSKREQEVLQLLAKGENYRTIAAQLFISANTVKSHIKNIYEKLQVHTRAEAINKAINDRLL